MKTAQPVNKPTRLLPSKSPNDNPNPELDSLNLSPESAIARASTKTQVLIEILERDTRSYQTRYWGINE